MSVQFIDNSPEFLQFLHDVLDPTLEALGQAGESFAKLHITEEGAIDTGNLRNSISHKADPANKEVQIGTNSHYAIYVEMGTGAGNVAGGTTKESWVYRDAHGEFHTAHPMRPRPFIGPSVSEHGSEYQAIIDRYFRGK